MGNYHGREYGGARCHWCEGVRWSVGEQPRWLTSSLYGIGQCDGWPPWTRNPNGSWLLEYNAPCHYGLHGDTFEMTWIVDFGVSWLVFFDTIRAYFSFDGISFGPCAGPFTNQNSCPNDPSELGGGVVHRSNGPIGIFATDYKMFDEDYYEYEEWELADDINMYRLCDGTHRVNCLFKFDKQANLNI